MMSVRRLPVYILLDTSGSMKGEPIHSVNVGLQAMISGMRQDPYALDSVYLSIITFDIEAREIMPLTALSDVQLNEITVPQSGATFLGAALQLFIERVDRDVRKNTKETKGDWRPLLFVMTDGNPSDIAAYRKAIIEIKKRNFGAILACAAGPKAKQEALLELTDRVVTLDTMDSAAFLGFFKWVSASVSIGSSSNGLTEQINLPPPPPEVNLVL
ncbi:MAG: VWA domain-containing protein [Helicobacteraceae bacterium]|nr:VWA domain-containing protein [Helicobacteraceae bacterium]